MGYSSMHMGLYPLHLLQNSLFKEFLKTKESDIENHTKIWKNFEGMLTMWLTLFLREPHVIR
jgi:hypothetical protein